MLAFNVIACLSALCALTAATPPSITAISPSQSVAIGKALAAPASDYIHALASIGSQIEPILKSEGVLSSWNAAGASIINQVLASGPPNFASLANHPPKVTEDPAATYLPTSFRRKILAAVTSFENAEVSAIRSVAGQGSSNAAPAVTVVAQAAVVGAAGLAGAAALFL